MLNAVFPARRRLYFAGEIALKADADHRQHRLLRHFMIAGPGITRHGHIDASTMAVYDVAPTLYEFAGIDPNKSLAKKPVLPMIGVSFKSRRRCDRGA
jgi:predicted AlkP superfamily phosphohydrolase/phosphomutase